MHERTVGTLSANGIELRDFASLNSFFDFRTLTQAEVGLVFRDSFLEQDGANQRLFTAGPAGKPHFDLPAFALHRLIQAGVGEAETLRLDTYSEPGLFYSFRRATHRGEPSYGRQISMIGLAPKS